MLQGPTERRRRGEGEDHEAGRQVKKGKDARGQTGEEDRLAWDRSCSGCHAVSTFSYSTLNGVCGDNIRTILGNIINEL